MNFGEFFNQADHRPFGYFAIVDVIAALSGRPNPQVYWRVMKKRLLAEGNQTVTWGHPTRSRNAHEEQVR
jgi:hypothetical protein